MFAGKTARHQLHISQVGEVEEGQQMSTKKKLRGCSQSCVSLLIQTKIVYPQITFYQWTQSQNTNDSVVIQAKWRKLFCSYGSASEPLSGPKMHAMKRGWGVLGYVSFRPALGSARVLLWWAKNGVQWSSGLAKLASQSCIERHHSALHKCHHHLSFSGISISFILVAERVGQPLKMVLVLYKREVGQQFIRAYMSVPVLQRCTSGYQVIIHPSIHSFILEPKSCFSAFC